MRHLINYDYLVTIDGDCIIVKPEFDLLAYIKSLPVADLYINRDENNLCNGIVVWRNTVAARRFIRRWRDFWHRGFCDQVAMIRLLAGHRDGMTVYEVPQRKLNAFMRMDTDWLLHLCGPKNKGRLHQAFVDEYGTGPLTPVLPKGGKRAALVLGSESSGSRLWMEHLLACGAQGDAGHHQPFDNSFDGAGDLIAWRQSFPCGEHMPNTGKMVERLRAAGFTDIVIFWTQRDRQCTIKSIIDRHSKTEKQATREVEDGMHRIGCFVRDNDLPCRIVRYERLIADPAYRLNLLSAFGLAPVGSLPEIYDGNARWLTATTSTTQLVRAEQIDIPKMSNRLG